MKKALALVASAILIVTLAGCATEPKPESTASENSSLALTKATGEAQPVQTGFPTISLADNGEPTIKQVGGAAPAEFKLATTIKGTGNVVTLSDLVTVHYSGWVWGGDLFDSSWTRGEPAQFSLQQVIPGFTKALEGQTVGSQVIAVIPPAEGYGEQEVGGIPANSTLIFVVDILAATALPQ